MGDEETDVRARAPVGIVLEGELPLDRVFGGGGIADERFLRDGP
jgi:hypothetical protein